MTPPDDAKGSIGSRIWVFDENLRMYGKDRSGPIWREHWRERKIIGETSRSWIVGPKWDQLKIPKKGANPRVFAFSEHEINEQAFLHDHRYRIGRMVDSLTDPTVLRAVAELVGYKPCRL